MDITYARPKVKKILENVFFNPAAMKEVLSPVLVKAIKKYMNLLDAAETFGDFLDLKLGRAELLVRPKKSKTVSYSLHLTANTRLILVLDGPPDVVRSRTEVTVKGVCDYHGGKETWYIS